MQFAASRPELGGALMGAAAGSTPSAIGGMMKQERNQICLQSDPPQCFDIDDPFQQSESGGIKNEIFDKNTIRQGGFTQPSELDRMDIREILRRNEEKFKAGIPLAGAIFS